jgi:hypothetical protein
VPPYIIRVFKSWQVRDVERRWVNTYEVEHTGASPADLIETANDIADAERLIHRDAVQFLSATISTWEPDSKPYNPLAFTTVELTGTGAVLVSTGQPVDSNVCFVVKREATLGRSGRLFYRGCLLESDIETGGDLRVKLTPGTGLAQGGANFGAFVTAMQPMMATTGAPARLILIQNPSTPGEVAEAGPYRYVTSLKSAGVTINRRNHRYFDRASV